MRPTSARLHAFVLAAALAALMLGDVASGAHANVKFTGPTNYGTGIRPSAMAVGDFNQDSHPDLAVGNRSGGLGPALSILLGAGDGTFGAQTGVNANADPTSIAVADFDGDSHLDLAIASCRGDWRSPSCSARGTAPSAAPFRRPQEPVRHRSRSATSTATDTPTSRSPTNSPTTSRRCSQGRAGPSASRPITPPARIPRRLRSASSTATRTPTLRWPTCSRTPSRSSSARAMAPSVPATGFAAGPAPVSVAVGDFNGDSHADLAVANETSGNASVLLGAGDGTFGAPSQFPSGSSPASIAVGDFDGDAHRDLALANNYGANVSVLLGAGDGTFPTTTQFNADHGPLVGRRRRLQPRLATRPRSHQRDLQ